MNPEAIARIRKVAPGGANELDLRGLALEELPEELTALKQLRKLRLDGNVLQTLPDWLAELGELEEIDLARNRFAEVPRVLRSLPKLLTIFLDSNEIKKIPDWIGELRRLKALYLNENAIDHGIDRLMALAHRLEEFGADRPVFDAIQEALIAAGTLEWISLSGRLDIVVVDQLGQIRSLTGLGVSGAGELPPNLGELKQLQMLDVSGNQLETLPESVGQLKQLQRLYASSNKLTTLPDGVGQLAQLQQLYLSNNKLTLLPDGVGQLVQLQQLNVSYNQLTALPDSLSQLAQLQQLDVSGNQLTALPDSVGKLTQLQQLSVGSNQLAALPESVGQLGQLQQLQVWDNQLVALPDSVGKLAQLQQLLVSSNQLVALPESVGKLARLQELQISGNQLVALPESVGQLVQLKQLYAGDNQLTVLPESVSRLAQLQQLHLGVNQLTVLPESVGQLAQLLELGVSFNKLKALPDSVGQLALLQQLDASGNQLTSLPESVGQLANLQQLDVSANQLTSLPESVGQLARLQQLDVSRNRLSALPLRWDGAKSLDYLDSAFNDLVLLPEELRQLTLRSLWLQSNPRLGLSASVLGDYQKEPYERLSERPPRDPASILEAYFAARAEGALELNEVKMVLVGRGSAGKTSIARRLVKDKFSKSQKETQGIDIARWKLACADREVTVNVWDFAGQVVTHATHQFFLSESSVYALVLTGREDTHRIDAEYWLKLIRAFAKDDQGTVAPVIVVLNKFDVHPFKVDRVALRERYPFIAGFVETDCQSGRGIEELRSRLAETVAGMPLVRQAFTPAWWNIKEDLEKQQRKRNHLPYRAFQAICDKRGETDPTRQRFLADVFHALGVALNYGRDPRLRDATVLNPRWVTEGIYKLLREGVNDDGTAVLDWASVQRVLPGEDDEMRRYLLALMQRFDLAFPLGDANDEWLVPQRLPAETPELGEFALSDGDEHTHLRFSYPVIPEGLLPRFIARTYPLNESPDGGVPLPRWNSGVALQQGDARALVRVDGEERRVNVIVSGEKDARLELLGVIQSDLRTIHGDIKGLGEQEYLKVGEAYVLVDALKADERARKPSSASTSKGTIEINPTKELNRLSLPPARDEQSRRARVFISYTTANSKQRDDLLVLLKPLKETHGLLESWDDRCIPAGGDWDGEIRAELEHADVVLLLVSAKFLASTYVRDVEVKRALERAQGGACRVVPIILEKVDWTGESFGKFNALPPKGKAIQLFNPRNNGWYEVGVGLRKLLEDLSVSTDRGRPTDTGRRLSGVPFHAISPEPP